MCTVTFFPKGSNYLVGMNRDELLTRGPAESPRVHVHASGSAIHPTDAEGGTWVAANEFGISYAILNWSFPPHTAKLRSRGEVIIGLLPAHSAAEAELHMHSADFHGMRPFRLIGFVPADTAIREWQWDGVTLQTRNFPWEPHHWFSSGLSDEKAASHRSLVTQNAAHFANAGSVEWLRDLHRSHLPERGAFSICVHRDDAATLSYTEIVVAQAQVTMRYRDGSPCRSQPFDSELDVRRVHPAFTNP